MLKPKRLTRGSKIAVVSPSSGVPYLFPDIYELGLKNLKEKFGFEIVEMPTSRMSPEELYKNPKLRAEDLNRAFADETIHGIIASIGGYESIRILRYLDTETILKNPKFIMGYSDATTYLSYLNMLGMVTFYGPSVMSGLAQLKHLPVEFEEHLKEFLFKEYTSLSYKTFNTWADSYKNWSDKTTLGECREFYNNEGWIFLQGEVETEGALWGGCIEVLEFLKGTDYWPDKEFWKDKILFFEMSEDKPLPFQVGYMLRNYGIQGILNKVKGIMFGRPKGYSKEETDELYNTVTKILRDEFNVVDIPVVMNMDFGHTDPKIIMPLGCRVKITPDTKEVKLLESPFV
jgi:muramoyltetrapeptide carboxypeptidase LdcA involved in peptidoglycan recycling